MTAARLQVRLNDQDDALIERLQKLMGLKTRTAVIENALMLLGWAASQAYDGLAIASVDEKRQRYNEVHLPALDRVRFMGQAKDTRQAAALTA